MKYIQGQDNQLALFPDLIDSRIDEENPVGTVDVFVDSLNMSNLGFQRVVTARNGRPGYDPRDLLKLYLYGYMTVFFIIISFIIFIIHSAVRRNA